MLRKTNLFYTSGNDSNFITFSNYTESLTANFLATDWKLYPDKFLCMNIPSLDNDTKADFIKHIAANYENKLAFMRDKEVTTYPLEWLIESIESFDSNMSISFIGDVTEQHYTGVYSDTICTIDATERPKQYTLNVHPSDDTESTIVDYDADMNYLYGWYANNNGNIEYKGASEYESTAPVLDTESGYNKSIKYASITSSASDSNDIQFNVIIPLFVVMDIYYRHNNDIIDETTPIVFNYNPSMINVPIGMWFANDMVTLHRDDSRYAPAWTLLLSSQFKPFPYVAPQDMPNELTHSDCAGEAYATFAQVLARQNSVLSEVQKLLSAVTTLTNKVNAIETAVGNIGTEMSITDIKNQVSYLNTFATNIVTSMNTTAEEHDMKWQTQFTQN